MRCSAKPGPIAIIGKAMMASAESSSKSAVRPRQAAPKQEITHRPCGDGQDCAKQNRGGEWPQHRQNANDQSPEEQEDNGAFKELGRAGVCLSSVGTSRG